MKLREQFEKYNYKSILQNDELCSLDISYFLDENKKVPEELLDIYISSQGDEIVILLNGDKKDIHTMCDEWDNKINVSGILKFKDARSEDRVSVEVCVKDGDEEHIICRKQEKDELECSSRGVEIWVDGKKHKKR